MASAGLTRRGGKDLLKIAAKYAAGRLMYMVVYRMDWNSREQSCARDLTLKIVSRAGLREMVKNAISAAYAQMAADRRLGPCGVKPKGTPEDTPMEEKERQIQRYCSMIMRRDNATITPADVINTDLIITGGTGPAASERLENSLLVGWSGLETFYFIGWGRFDATGEISLKIQSD